MNDHGRGTVDAVGVRLELPGGAVLSLPTDAPVELATAAIRAVLPDAARQERATR